MRRSCGGTWRWDLLDLCQCHRALLSEGDFGTLQYLNNGQPAPSVCGRPRAVGDAVDKKLILNGKGLCIRDEWRGYISEVIGNAG